MRETAYRCAENAEDGPLPMACWSCKSPDVARSDPERRRRADTSTVSEARRPGNRQQLSRVVPTAIKYQSPHQSSPKAKPELTLSRPYAALARWKLYGKPFEKVGRFDQQSMVCGQCRVWSITDGKNKVVKFLVDDA
ncbi:ammonia-forming cytochrome c nitrite reductase subunit c552 [Klebsiella pneumoniae]|uniref:ammonia-forming cytochrome c nitrite reductase subunit c552 n=1 Tax=Klebsiella pneumoniae TaxID=573 RepID=UPI003D344A39